MTETESEPQVIDFEPIGSEPLSYPLAGPSTLSADAALLLEHGSGYGAGRLDRDLFAGERELRRYVTEEQARAFVPTSRMIAALEELKSAGLTGWRPGASSFRATALHKHYTYARGRGAHFIKISTFDEHPDDSKLLAVLMGADLQSRRSDYDLDVIELLAQHPTACDIEHSTSHTAKLVVANPSVPRFSRMGNITFTGVLRQAYLYPIGVDPLRAYGDDGPSDELCSMDGCEPHPFAPYLGQEIADLRKPTFVRVEVSPLRARTALEPPAFPADAEPFEIVTLEDE